MGIYNKKKERGTMLKEIVAVVFLVSVTASERCCVPKEWEGNYGWSIGLANKNERLGKNASIFGRIYYDANKQLVTLSGGSTNSDGRTFLDTYIMDFPNKKMYQINIERLCTVTELDAKFQEYCVPENAQLQAQSKLGLGENNELKVDSWQLPMPEINGLAFFTVTSDGCLPQGETIFGSTLKDGNYEEGYQASGGMSGVNYGIKDRSVFDPPDFCPKGKVEMREELKILLSKFS